MFFQALHRIIKFHCIKNFPAISFLCTTTYASSEMTLTLQFLALGVLYDLLALSVTLIDTFVLKGGVQMRVACALLETTLCFVCVSLQSFTRKAREHSCPSLQTEW